MEQVADLITNQLHFGWADNFIWNDQVNENPSDMDKVIVEARAFLATLEKKISKRPSG